VVLVLMSLQSSSIVGYDYSTRYKKL